MRLFAVVTSFSPLRLSLYREGLLFWTHGAYSVEDDKSKRKYITDYFFTEAQSDIFQFASELRAHVKENSDSKYVSKKKKK